MNKNNINKEIYYLKDISKIFKGKGLSKSEINLNGKNKCIHYGELFTNYGEIIKQIKSKTNIKKDKMVLSENNDLLMPTSDVTPKGLATFSAILEKGVILGGDMLIFRLDKSKIVNTYLSYYLTTNKNIIQKLATGSTVYHIYEKDFKNLKIKVPSIQEQQKIADFLSSIDKELTLLKKEKKSVEEYKKGMMQKIFSQELRFKDENGEYFGEWEEKEIKEKYNVFNGKTVEAGLDNYLEIGNINNTDYSYKLENKKTVKGAKRVEKNTLLISTVRPNLKKITITLEDLYVSSAFASIKLKNTFLFHYITTDIVTNKILSLVEGSNYPTINKEYIYKLKLSFPTSIKEEEKIAEFLSSIDKELELIDKKIKKVENFKKGIMQRLFN